MRPPPRYGSFCTAWFALCALAAGSSRAQETVSYLDFATSNGVEPAQEIVSGTTLLPIIVA